MYVYLTAIEGHVPHDMVKTLQAFLDFCYIACQNFQNTWSLAALLDALECFHRYHTIFIECGVWMDEFALLRHHSLVHYVALIHAFGALNRLCSSITELKHIKAVKEPWCHFSHYKALGQMLLTNQQMDKLATSCVDFTKCGMLKGTCLDSSLVALSMCPNICL